jgi:hypothetical protein
MLSRLRPLVPLQVSIVLLAVALGLAPSEAQALVSSQESHLTNPVPTLVLNGLGKGTVPLEGLWQFHLGDDPSWAAEDWNDSNWEQLTADQGWGAQGHDSYAGYAWYRRHIRVVSLAGSTPDFAILLPRVEDAYDLYWNGVQVGSFGGMPPHPVWYYHPPPHTFGLGPMREGVLAIRVWKAPLSSFDAGTLGGFESVPILGSPKDIAAAKAVGDYAWMRSHQLAFAVLFLYVLVVVLGFVGWLRDRSQWVLFWMAAYCFSPVFTTLLGGMRLPISYPIAIGSEQPMFALLDISLWFLLITLLQLGDREKLIRWVRIAAIADMVSSVLDGFVNLPLTNPHLQEQAQIADGILTGIVTVVEVIPMILLVFALTGRKQLDSERWVVAIFASFAQGIEALQTTAEQGERFTHWTWGNRIGDPMFTVLGNAVTLETAARILLLLSLIYAIYRNSVETRRKQGAIEQEFKNARELQQVLVPEELPPMPGFAITSAYRPAAQVGGDFFQIIPLSDGATLLILGDVSGKGLRAAMAVSLIVGATRMIAEYTSNPAEILSGLNRRLYNRMSGGFATAIAMRLDANGNCTLAAAGHPSPYLNQSELQLTGALPLGLNAATVYEEYCFKLQVGDHFALYTDGLLEARNHAGELYGFERLEKLFASRPNATQATEAAVNFGQDDDITVLTLTRLAKAEESSASHSAPKLAPV